MTIQDLRAMLEKHKMALKEKYHISSFFIFGSYAREEATASSDIDMLVDFNQSIDLLDFVRLKYELEDIFGKSVDLGTPNGLKKTIKTDILNEAIAL